MSGGVSLPSVVLSEQLAEAIAGRRVSAAVFTTFSFDPGFFEQHIVPVLFDLPLSLAPKVRAVQLDDAMAGIDLAVYYDRNALAPDAEPAQLDFRRVDVGRKTGAFHPKLCLLLVEEPVEETDTDEEPVRHQSLIVGILSANLTRAGWWENVECGHFEEINDREIDRSRVPYRKDLLGLLRELRGHLGEGDDTRALDRIHDFLRERTIARGYQRARAGGAYLTRIFYGQKAALGPWLGDLLVDRGELNLEVVSPYFDATGARPLVSLIEAVRPREVRIYLPTDDDGKALVSESAHEAVAALPGCHWAALPAGVAQRSQGKSADKLARCRVHAKIYRLWRRGGPELVLVGSANLTTPGHSRAKSGNAEAMFLVDVGGTSARRFWLERLDAAPERFVATAPPEEEAQDERGLPLSVRFDWRTRRLSIRLDAADIAWIELGALAGGVIARIEKPEPSVWIDAAPAAGEELTRLLASTSFLEASAPDHRWRVLVREEGMAHRPSLLFTLTPEEILQYWSLLTPAQRVAFIEERGGSEAAFEGLALPATTRLTEEPSMFSRFAGIYHAFECLARQIDEALAEGRVREAEARLLGAKLDSLPQLLDKSFDKAEQESDGDPVAAYVTFLAARQLLDQVRANHPGFLKERKAQVQALRDSLDRTRMLRKKLDCGPDSVVFLDWYETQFLRRVDRTRDAGVRP